MMHLGNELLKDKRVVKLAAKDVVYGTSNLRSVFDYVQDNISSGKTVTRLVDDVFVNPKLSHLITEN